MTASPVPCLPPGSDLRAKQEVLPCLEGKLWSLTFPSQVQAGKADADSACNEEQGRVLVWKRLSVFILGSVCGLLEEVAAEPSPSSPSTGDPAECKELPSSAVQVPQTLLPAWWHMGDFHDIRHFGLL